MKNLKVYKDYRGLEESSIMVGVKESTGSVPKKYEHIDFVPPKGAKQAAIKALEWREKYGRGMTPVGVKRAVQLKSGKAMSPETVRRMAQFNRHRKNSKGKHNDGGPSAGKIAWYGWGGDVGINWAMRVSNQMKKADEVKATEITASKDRIKIMKIDPSKMGPFKLTIADKAEGLYLRLFKGLLSIGGSEINFYIFGSYTTYEQDGDYFVQKMDIILSGDKGKFLYRNDSAVDKYWKMKDHKASLEKGLQHVQKIYGERLVKSLQGNAVDENVVFTTKEGGEQRSINNLTKLLQSNPQHLATDYFEVIRKVTKDISDANDAHTPKYVLLK